MLAANKASLRVLVKAAHLNAPIAIITEVLHFAECMPQCKPVLVDFLSRVEVNNLSDYLLVLWSLMVSIFDATADHDHAALHFLSGVYALHLNKHTKVAWKVAVSRITQQAPPLILSPGELMWCWQQITFISLQYWSFVSRPQRASSSSSSSPPPSPPLPSSKKHLRIIGWALHSYNQYVIKQERRASSAVSETWRAQSVILKPLMVLESELPRGSVDSVISDLNRGGLVFPAPPLHQFSIAAYDFIRSNVNLDTYSDGAIFELRACKERLTASSEVYDLFQRGVTQVTQSSTVDLRPIYEGVISKLYNAKTGELVRALNEAQIKAQKSPEYHCSTREQLKASDILSKR
jgi:hypothetical protein